MTRPRIFVATPLHDARMGHAYMHGGLSLLTSGLLADWRFINGTSLQRQRDQLVDQFVKSECTHLLFVDSDIGWTAEDALALLKTGKDFIGGTYAKKTFELNVAALPTDVREGELYEAKHVATGFLLVSRAGIERLLEHRKAFHYMTGGQAFTSLFHQAIDEGTEDLSFCRFWRESGGTVWLHTGVVLAHYDGNTPYYPGEQLKRLRAPIEAEQASDRVTVVAAE